MKHGMMKKVLPLLYNNTIEPDDIKVLLGRIMAAHRERRRL